MVQLNQSPIQKQCAKTRVEEINSSQLTQKVLEKLGFLFRIKKIHKVKKHAEKRTPRKESRKTAHKAKW